MPKDPVMLLSFVNTQLRDNYPSLKELAAAYNAEEDEIIDKIKTIGYQYDAQRNQFVIQ